MCLHHGLYRQAAPPEQRLAVADASMDASAIQIDSSGELSIGVALQPRFQINIKVCAFKYSSFAFARMNVMKLALDSLIHHRIL